MSEIMLPPKWRDWTIVETIGEGGFGTVYRAEKNDGVVKSVSAIKVIEITTEGTRTASLMRRFKTDEAAREYLWGVVEHCAEEIRTMYRLQGESNLVSIQDHLIEEMEDRVGWRLYIRMEFLQSFNDYLTTHPMTQRDIARLGISLCGALEKCEKMNILHRDIKPENIFVSSSGEFKLGDFGVSRVLEATHAQYTSEGTFGYMAPEVYKGQPCGREADIYSLGLVLYVLANKNCEPFVDTEKQLVSYGDLQSAFERRMKGEPLPEPVEADPALGKVLVKACAYRPALRYRSAAAFREALEPLAKAKRPSRLRWIALGTLVVALLAAGAAFLAPRLRPHQQMLPEGFEAAGTTGTWRDFRRDYGEDGAALIAIHKPTPYDVDGKEFEANATALFQSLLAKRPDVVAKPEGPFSYPLLERSKSRHRLTVNFVAVDGQRGTAAMIFDDSSRTIYPILMVVPEGLGAEVAPDFEAVLDGIDPPFIDRLFEDGD